MALGIIVLIAFIFMPLSEVMAEKDPDKKMWVCHKGNSINVSLNSAQQHLNHGDDEGKCE